MRGIKSAVIPLLVVAFVLPDLARADDRLYLSADLGQVSYLGLAARSGSTSTPTPFSNDTTATYRAAIGLGINDDFGVEVGYVSFYDGYIGNVPESGNGPTCCAVGTYANTVSADGISVEVVNTHPLSPSWSYFGRAGLLLGSFNINNTFITSRFGVMSSTYVYNHLEGTLGAGLRWNFADNWAAHVSLDYYLSSGSNNYVNPYSLRTLALGVDYYY